MSDPLISVIMPCYNSADTIASSIESVFSQTYSNIELIVIDDGSTDDSIAILKSISQSDSRLKIIQQNNKGAGPARNTGLSVAEGEYIAFLDSDDTWETGCLRKLHQGFIISPDAVLCYCGWQNLGVSENQSQPFVPPDYEVSNKLEILLEGCRWPIHAALTKKQVIQDAQCFDTTLTSCMDFDLWLRISAFNKIVLVPEVLAYYHHHEGEQITKNKVRIARNHLKVQEKFIRMHPEIFQLLSKDRLNEITYGALLRRAYDCYWKRDLESARIIFRMAMKTGYPGLTDMKYILPCYLPVFIHKATISLLG
ncbi:MAG: glycosyltransferase [Gammaproteobacteria bacterium]|nr:glycosyltransferase [Gammaproteobacteria bacterium]